MLGWLFAMSSIGFFSPSWIALGLWQNAYSAIQENNRIPDFNLPQGSVLPLEREGENPGVEDSLIYERSDGGNK